MTYKIHLKKGNKIIETIVYARNKYLAMLKAKLKHFSYSIVRVQKPLKDW